jgi:outer membrane receptor protein involved in Fe transport
VTAYNNCFNFNGTSNPTYSVSNYYCSLIKRDPLTGDRAEVASLYLNLGTLKTQGVDVAVSWAHDLGPGSFSVRSNLSYLIEYKYQPDATQPEADARGTLDKGGQYKYRLLTDLGYRFHNDFNVGLQWRHLPSVNDASLALNPSSTVLGTGAYDLFNLSAGYNLGKYQLRVGVDNLLDKAPPVVGANPSANDTNSNQTNAQYYDVLGRRFYVGVKAKF